MPHVEGKRPNQPSMSRLGIYHGNQGKLDESQVSEKEIAPTGTSLFARALIDRLCWSLADVDRNV